MYRTMNDRRINIKGYKISGFDIDLYCKISEYNIGGDNYKCTMSFGGGSRKYCLIASYSAEKPMEIYIDRIEKRDVCSIGNILSNYDEGTIKLVKTSLWAMKKMYPHVLKYTLKDNSQIYCDGENSKDTMHMAYDYILKYNETWYQRKFNAELPGFISKNAPSITNTGNKHLMHIIAEPQSLMYNVYKSFEILDKQLDPYELVIDVIPTLKSYREEYESSDTPRQFIDKLRRKLGNDYCRDVGKWLNSYMLYLNISIEMEHWYILEKYINEVPNFSASILPLAFVNRMLGGGRNLQLQTRKNNSTKYRQPRKCYHIVSNSVVDMQCVDTFTHL